MYLGKLVEVGPADEILGRPAHPTRQACSRRSSHQATRTPRHEGKELVDVRGELPRPPIRRRAAAFAHAAQGPRTVCAAQEPPLRPFTVPSHQAACHFPLQRPLA